MASRLSWVTIWPEERCFLCPEVINGPISVASVCCPASVSSAVSVPNLFPVCAVTRAQARKLGENVDLCE